MTTRAFSRQRWADGVPSPAASALAFASRATTAIHAASQVLHEQRRGREVVLDPSTMLHERARLAGWDAPARGVSVGGGSRLLRASSGWISLSLARDDDRELLPALFECDAARFEGDAAAMWAAVRAEVATRRDADVVERAALLGMSAAVAGERTAPPSAPPASTPPTSTPPTSTPPTSTLAGTAPGSRSPLLVVDLSVLWAGPLCAHVLGLAGAEVVKVEAVGRLDGARDGAPAFYDLLHGGHDAVLVDFRDREDLAFLHRLVAVADVVITSSRPRALDALGIDPRQLLRAQNISAWVSITGFGPSEPDRIGFGDDAAIAGGLIDRRDPEAPGYVLDAVADPLTGLVAAARVLELVASRARSHVEVDLASVAAAAAACEPSEPQPTADPPATTRRRSDVPAAAPGAHTERWRARCA